MSDFTHANYDAWKTTPQEDDGVLEEVMEDMTYDKRLCPYCKTKLVNDKDAECTYCLRCSDDDGYDPALNWKHNWEKAITYKVKAIRDARNDPS